MAQPVTNIIKIGNPLLRMVATPFTPSEILSAGTQDVVKSMLAAMKGTKAVLGALLSKLFLSAHQRIV